MGKVAKASAKVTLAGSAKGGWLGERQQQHRRQQQQQQHPIQKSKT